MWSVPQRLKTLAEVEVRQGRYADADDAYDRASAFVDSLVGNYSSVLAKTAVITASSEIYTEHFALVARQLHQLPKAYSIVEQVRGRVLADLLMSGSARPGEAANTEKAIARLRIKLMAPTPPREVQRIRDQIFMAEQARWITPDISILKARSRETIGIAAGAAESQSVDGYPRVRSRRSAVVLPRHYAFQREDRRVASQAADRRVGCGVSESGEGETVRRC